MSEMRAKVCLWLAEWEVARQLANFFYGRHGVNTFVNYDSVSGIMCSTNIANPRSSLSILSILAFRVPTPADST